MSLSDLVELRLAIETAALIRAAQAPVLEHLEEAWAALDVMAAPRVTQAAFYEADVAFHAALQPGALNVELKAAAKERGLWYSPDPSSYETCSIGLGADVSR